MTWSESSCRQWFLSEIRIGSRWLLQTEFIKGCCVFDRHRQPVSESVDKICFTWNWIRLCEALNYWVHPVWTCMKRFWNSLIFAWFEKVLNIPGSIVLNRSKSKTLQWISQAIAMWLMGVFFRVSCCRCFFTNTKSLPGQHNLMRGSQILFVWVRFFS